MHPRLRALLAALVVLVSLGAMPSAPAATPPGPLHITELLANPDATQGQREFIELWNPGNHSIDLAGWTLRDAPTTSGSTNEFTFASAHLAPGARIVVWSNGSADARGPSWSSSAGKTVWNDAGDAATLLDPSGVVADWFAYGNTAQTPPAGFEGQAKPAAAPRGLSLALEGGAWSPLEPSPGLAPGVTGGLAGATILNVAPTVSLSGIPETVKPGQAVEVTLHLADGNGPADLVSWTLAINGGTVAQGEGPVAPPFSAVAPAVSGPWAFTLKATDAGGLTAEQTVNATVRDARLLLQLPSGVLRFPDLRPGERNVTALDWATLRNEGTDPARPLLDVSPFAGPVAIPVDGRLSIGVAAGDNATTWIAYAGPLTPLPSIPPGSSLRMTLRLDEVPQPLAAGNYGTTFAVVTA